MGVNLYIKDILIKQFSDQEEEILINRKLKDYRDIEKIFGDYTESFTVPANSNNEVFKHYYDADIDGGFDARVKQDAYIELDGQLWKRGEVQLIDVEIKDNRPESYKIQFFGEVTQLVDLFGEDELNQLDYSDLVYDYTYENVKTGLTTGLFNEKIIYPLLSYKRRFLYNTDIVGLDDEFNVDIAKGGPSDFEGINWKELKPAIKTSTIFQKIQDFYGLTFTGDIFSDFRFDNIYMNLVSQKNAQSETSSQIITDTINLNFVPGLNVIDITTTPNTNFDEVDYGIRVFINNVLKFDTGLSLSGTTIRRFEFVENSQNINFRLQVYSSESFLFDYDATYTVTARDDVFTSEQFIYNGVDEELTSQVSVNNQLQEFKIKDFIKAFVKAFNLVLIPIDATTIEFQSLQPWYATGRIIDITSYVKTDKLRVASGQLISGLDLKYEKTETFLSSVFLENNNRSFGELDIDFTDSNGKVFNGETLEVTLPFEKIVFEKIGEAANALTYGYLVNREQEEFNPFHSIFYGLQRTGSIFLKDSSGTSEEITSFRQPRTAFGIDGFALNFEVEIDEFNNNASTDNFYTRYYADYVDDLFSAKRRQYNLEAKLPKFISQDLKLNDRILIGQRIYLINSLQQNLTTDNVKFELLNDIFTGAEALNQIIDLEDSTFLIESNATTLTTNKVGNANIDTIASNEAFVTPTFTGGQITLSVTENTTGSLRNAIITVTFDDVDSTQKTIQVIQKQEEVEPGVQQTEFNVDNQQQTLTTQITGASPIDTITSSDPFVTPSFNGSTITLNVEANLTTLERLAVVTVTFADLDGTVVLLDITQSG